MANVKLPIEGSCQCGGVRYEITAAPIGIYCCHCTNCQKITGSAFVLSAAVPEPAFAFTKGKPGKTEWKSDSGNHRYGHYCRDCGCRIAHVTRENDVPSAVDLDAPAAQKLLKEEPVEGVVSPGAVERAQAQHDNR